MKKKKIELKKLQLNKERIAPLLTYQLDLIKGGNLTGTIVQTGTSLAANNMCTTR